MNAYDVQRTLADVSFPGYCWVVGANGDRIYLQATFIAPDCKTGVPEVQYTRKW